MMTPCPSPDEAVRFAGEEKNSERNVTDIKASINDDPVVVVVEPMTADSQAINDEDHPNDNNAADVNNKLATTSPAASASTLNNDDITPAVVTEDGDDSNEGDDGTDTNEASAAAKEPAQDDPAATALQEQQSSEPAVAVEAKSLGDIQNPIPLDPEILDGFDESLEVANLGLQGSVSHVHPANLSTLALIKEVDGGAWFPANPSTGITPRIEAFAKLEFHYGQDFYLSTVNIVLGRQDKEPSATSKRKKRRLQEELHDSDTIKSGEVKVPLFPPTDIDISSISRRHLRIKYDYDSTSWKLTALCDTGFRLIRSGKDRFFPAGRGVTLQNTDYIRFGNLAFTWLLPDDDGDDGDDDDVVKAEDENEGDVTLRASQQRDVSSSLGSDHDSDDGDDEDEDSDIDSREQSHENGTPTPRKLDGTDDASLMPPPPVKRGRGRPPKNGISVREQKLLKRQAQEEFLANGGDVSNLDMSKYGNLPVEKLFAKEGEKMQMQIEKEARRKQKMEEKEAKIREKQAAKDSKPTKIPKERKRKRTKSPPAREEDYTPEQLAKPSIPYTVMIYEAIQESEKKALTLPEIYRSLETAYPYFKVRAETTGWQSSVRHNLRGSGEGGGSSLFERGERSGKGYIWKIAEGANIDKERKKRKPVTGSPHTVQASMQATPQHHPSAPSTGGWGQSSAQGGQYGHPAQFTQQYQSQQITTTVQTFNQTNYQAKAPTAPTIAISSAPRPSASGPDKTVQRAAVQPNVPPPPAWNPAQAKPQTITNTAPTPHTAASSNAAVARPPQQIKTTVVPQTQPIRPQQVTTPATQPSRAPANVTASSAPIPGPAVPVTQPVSTIEAQPGAPAKIPTAIDHKARHLLDNPTFLKIMREHVLKYPGHDINSPEVRKALWAEFKKTTAAKTPIMKTGVPKPPVAKAPLTPQKPVVNLLQKINQHTASTANPANTSIKTAPIPTINKPISGVPSQPPTAQTPKGPPQGQIKPSTPLTTNKPEQPTSAQRAGDILKGMSMDAQKKAKLLQFLKSAKEKKAAEALGAAKPSPSPIAGIKRPADAPPATSPVSKRTAIEGQQ
ncbi:Pre-rRNA-processing protein fhl1 [Orbilia ellipsospora]|uniref:Pre-rRNA-processing protein fhl1 n=1 Tax=Orbilia ellipsospora TaxID=2528407 RepID=A0AAV9WV90_9PEZI